MLTSDESPLCQECEPPEDDVDVDLKQALFNDPIVGEGQTLLDENGPGAIQPKPLATPPSMTPLERAIHNLTHLPYHPGCPICVSTRRPNSHHRNSHEHLRTIPLLVADYCFVKTTGDVKLQTILVLRLYPYRLFYAIAVPAEGSPPGLASFIAKFIRTTGVLCLAYRADRESALGTILDDAIMASARQGVRLHNDDGPAPADFSSGCRRGRG